MKKALSTALVENTSFNYSKLYVQFNIICIYVLPCFNLKKYSSADGKIHYIGEQRTISFIYISMIVVPSTLPIFSH